MPVWRGKASFLHLQEHSMSSMTPVRTMAQQYFRVCGSIMLGSTVWEPQQDVGRRKVAGACQDIYWRPFPFHGSSGSCRCKQQGDFLLLIGYSDEPPRWRIRVQPQQRYESARIHSPTVSWCLYNYKPAWTMEHERVRWPLQSKLAPSGPQGAMQKMQNVLIF